MAADHLFISYAWKDSAFADWLALRLAAEGYHVWMDRLKLLAGYPWPDEIDEAIKHKTARLLGIVSKDSLDRRNPRKEWKLAYDLANERKINFFIPLNLDGRKSTDLSWLYSDIQYVPFHHSWAGGLADLLKTLDASGVKRDKIATASKLALWRAESQQVEPGTERVWTNQLRFRTYPTRIHQYRFDRRVPKGWVNHKQSNRFRWSFAPPGDLQMKPTWTINWQDRNHGAQFKPRDVFVELMRKHIEGHLENRGLVWSEDHRYLYFPSGLVDGDRYYFTNYNGERRFRQLAGNRTRTRKSAAKLPQTETFRFHIAPKYFVNVDADNEPYVQLRLRVYLDREDGTPLDYKLYPSRRKQVTRSWFNNDLLSLSQATHEYLFGDAENRRMGLFDFDGFTTLTSPVALREQGNSTPSRVLLDISEGDNE